ncbi:Arm DNA-binding domain-containing protein [Bradyrhizobium sp. BWA-3-5]|uniref:DUF4102 domain-containing protein n=1 Tax=Bradyrhizobium sp. BWA-3-5 TaxID=3080013 RepID=UPI00293ED4F3|nr:Arm DNA-binding domain-containing protein [Bradyrhizobium sp. BWA-3-5]WOH69602.1 Arm DNA-binding domain-containing protein [Bradyrhizobium sp. BWA-3-5]
MAKPLTPVAVKSAKPGVKRLEIPDPGCQGLYLVVQTGGAKSWAFRYRFAGKPKKLTIGPVYIGSGKGDAPENAAGAVQAPDPILAAIEAHKATTAKMLSWVDRYVKLENELPAERRRSDVSREEIVETDDPRWIEAEREVGLAWDAEAAAAWALLEVLPTTREGLLILIEHAVSSREPWRDDWQLGLLENIAEALPQLWQEGRL